MDGGGYVPFVNPDMGYLNGFLDDVRIYDRALSAAEIAELYQGIVGDVSPPVISNIVPVDGVIIADVLTALSADFSDDRSGVDIASIQILFDLVDITNQAVVTEDGFSYTPIVPLIEGVHTLSISLSDNAGNSASAESQFELANSAPVVHVGQDFSVFITETSHLNASVTDDGLPSGTLTFQWSKQSGPGVVSFFDASSVETDITFTELGIYTLRLTVSDGELTTFDQITITVISEQWETTVINYEYDALNRLITVTEEGVVTTYTYDEAGNRIQETVAGVEAAP